MKEQPPGKPLHTPHRSMRSVRFWRMTSERMAEVSIGVGVASILAALILPATGIIDRGPKASAIETQLLRKNEEFSKELAAERAKVSQLIAQVAALSTGEELSADGAQLSLIRADLSNIEARLKSLEAGLMQDPAIALSIPLIRSDLENLTAQHAKDAASTTENINRVYDQNKWFLGLMGTMALALLGLGVSNFIQLRAK